MVSDSTSLAAAILAAAAFITSFLQFLLEYISSSESRSKCNRAAINFAAQDVSHKWSFTGWKMKLYYPELDMSCFRILQALETGFEHGIDYSEIRDFLDDDRMFWYRLSSEKVPRTQNVSDDLAALAWIPDKGDYEFRLVKESELSWWKRIRFWWWRYRHPLQLMRRPRASWSQIITACGIRKTESLKRRLIDADTISSCMDVPFQYVELSSLGMLCIIMGFKNITINNEDRTFHATGPSRAITTENIQTIGKVLRFDGDVFEIHDAVRSKYGIQGDNVAWMNTMAAMTCGAMFFGKYICGQNIHLPVDILAEAITLDSKVDEFESNVWNFIHSDESDDGVAGNLLKEAHNFQDLMEGLQSSGNYSGLTPDYSQSCTPARASGDSDQVRCDSLGIYQNIGNSDYRDHLKKEIRSWQDFTGLQIPTIFLAATFCSIHGLVVGFPSDQFLKPFLPWLQLEAKEMFQRVTAKFEPCTDFQRTIRTDTVPWLNSIEDFLSTGLGAAPGGLYSWGICSLAELYSQLPDSVKSSMVEYSLCKTGNNLNEYIRPKDRDVTRSIFMPHTLKLLADFRPQHWKYQLTGKQRFNVVKKWSADHLLWAQIILIDITIRLVVSGDSEKIDAPKIDGPQDKDDEKLGSPADTDNAQSWELREVHLVQAIAASWRIHERYHGKKPQHMLKWDLVPYLKESQAIQCSAGRSLDEKYERLADLLKTRVLFVVALFTLGPDTSDVFLAQEYSIHMPMI